MDEVGTASEAQEDFLLLREPSGTGREKLLHQRYILCPMSYVLCPLSLDQHNENRLRTAEQGHC